MPGPSIPSGPSPEQQRIDAEFERERVKYEQEKRRFLEQVASYETLSRGTIQARESSFENAPPTAYDASGLFIPARFDPSLNPTSNALGTEWFTGSGTRLGYRTNDQMSWYWAPNLGLRNPNA